MIAHRKDQTALLFKTLLSLIVGGVVAFFILHGIYHSITDKLETSLFNDKNRIHLGTHVIYDLVSIEADFYKTMTVFNRKGQEHISRQILNSVKDLKQVLAVVEDGGIYEHKISLNIAEQRSVTERVSYRPVHVDEYVVEILVLRTLLADIEMLTRENQALLDKRQATLAGESLHEIKLNAGRFTFFFYNLQAKFERMQEYANKLYYDSLKHSEKVQNEIEKRKKQYTFLATALSALFVIILFLLSFKITRRIHHRNRQLLESEAILKTVANHTHAWEYWIDPQGNFIYCSPSCEQLTGYLVDDFMADPELMHRIVCQKEKAMFRTHAAADDKNVCSFDFCIITAKKEERWCSHTCLAIYDQDGKYMGRRGSNFDITARKLAETELQNARASLEEIVEKRTAQLKQAQQQLIQSEKLSAIGSLSASIAHEFNNPLCGVRNVMERMNRKNTFNDTDQNLVTLALDECDRMKRLIHDLQSFNRPTNNLRKEIDLHQVIEAILSLIEKELKIKRISIVKEYSDLVPAISVVEDQLKQVLLNIIKNAGEAIGEAGGVVTISTSQKDKSVLIKIHDSGCGIKEELKEHIFEPFFTTKSAVKGTGLGLSVSYGIIKSHGGDIRVESEPGQGTSFTITLPVKCDMPVVREQIL